MSSAITINLPQASTCTGRVYNIKNINTGAVTIDAYSSETIDGAIIYSLLQNDSLSVQSTGSAWVII
jgi:hypothetical protein